MQFGIEVFDFRDELLLSIFEIAHSFCQPLLQLSYLMDFLSQLTDISLTIVLFFLNQGFRVHFNSFFCFFYLNCSIF